MTKRGRLGRIHRMGLAVVVIGCAALGGLTAAPAQAADPAPVDVIGDATLQDDGTIAVPVTRWCPAGKMELIRLEVTQAHTSNAYSMVSCNQPTIVIVPPSSEPFQVGPAMATTFRDRDQFAQVISINPSPPLITSTEHPFFREQSTTFTITTTGTSPSLRITQGALFEGQTFTDNGDGTATIKGRGWGSSSSTSILVEAKNAAGTDLHRFNLYR
jgi:hypothetical protein